MTEPDELCGATSIFWPDEEACEAECVLPRGHVPANVHRAEILGKWEESDSAAAQPYASDYERGIT